MFYVVVIAVFASLLGAMGSIAGSIKAEPIVVNARTAVLNYEIFKAAAESFAATSPAAGTYRWVNIKTQLAAGYSSNNTIPSSWKMVAFSGDQFVICTDHSSTAIPYIFQRFAQSNAPYQKTPTLIVSSKDYATAKLEESRCN